MLSGCSTDIVLVRCSVNEKGFQLANPDPDFGDCGVVRALCLFSPSLPINE